MRSTQPQFTMEELGALADMTYNQQFSDRLDLLLKLLYPNLLAEARRVTGRSPDERTYDANDLARYVEWVCTTIVDSEKIMSAVERERKKIAEATTIQY